MGNDYYELIPNGNYFEDKYTGMLYMESNGGYYPLIDPYMGGKLIPQEDGTFLSEYIGKTFSYDKTRNAFIPNFIPSLNGEDMEDAHIEGDYLVGNTSQQKYLIDSRGRILTDENIEFINKNKESQDKSSWKIEYNIDAIDEETNLEDYCNRISSLLNGSDQPLSVSVIVSNSKCYFSVHSKDNKTLSAKEFDFDESFYLDFLLPLLKSSLNKELLDQSFVVMPGDESAESKNIAFGTNNNSTILIQGVNEDFINELYSNLTNKNVK